MQTVHLPLPAPPSVGLMAQDDDGEVRQPGSGCWVNHRAHLPQWLRWGGGAGPGVGSDVGGGGGSCGRPGDRG